MFHDTAFGDLDAMASALRAHADSEDFGDFADSALTLAAALRDEPSDEQLEDAATALEYLVGVVDAHRKGL